MFEEVNTAETAEMNSLTWRISMSSSNLLARSCLKLSMPMLLIQVKADKQRLLHASWFEYHSSIVFVIISVPSSRAFTCVDLWMTPKPQIRPSMRSGLAPVVVNSVLASVTSGRQHPIGRPWRFPPDIAEDIETYDRL